MGRERMRVTQVRLVDGLYLMGAPGIGKTEIIRQKAMEEARSLNKVFVDLRDADDDTINEIFNDPSKYYVFIRVPATHIMPEDFAIPLKTTDKNAKYYEHIPPKTFAVLSLPGIHGVLFLDELNNVQREDQLTALFTLIQEKEIGWGVKLSKNVKVVAAGNPSEWSSVANTLPLPMRMGRVIVIEVDPPSVDDWINYMNKNYDDDWDKRTALYLKFFPQDFIKAKDKEDDGISPYPSPRSWTKLALLLKNVDDENFAVELAYGLLGKEVGARFEAVIRSYLTEDDMKKIEEDPSSFDDMTEAKKIVVLYSLINEPFRFIKLLKHLAASARDYFVIALMMMKKDDKVKLLSSAELKPLLKDLINVLKNYV